MTEQWERSQNWFLCFWLRAPSGSGTKEEILGEEHVRRRTKKPPVLWEWEGVRELWWEGFTLWGSGEPSMVSMDSVFVGLFSGMKALIMSFKVRFKHHFLHKDFLLHLHPLSRMYLLIYLVLYTSVLVLNEIVCLSKFGSVASLFLYTGSSLKERIASYSLV